MLNSFSSEQTLQPSQSSWWESRDSKLISTRHFQINETCCECEVIHLVNWSVITCSGSATNSEIKHAIYDKSSNFCCDLNLNMNFLSGGKFPGSVRSLCHPYWSLIQCWWYHEEVIIGYNLVLTKYPALGSKRCTNTVLTTCMWSHHHTQFPTWTLWC